MNSLFDVTGGSHHRRPALEVVRESLQRSADSNGEDVNQLPDNDSEMQQAKFVVDDRLIMSSKFGGFSLPLVMPVTDEPAYRVAQSRWIRSR